MNPDIVKAEIEALALWAEESFLRTTIVFSKIAEKINEPQDEDKTIREILEGRCWLYLRQIDAIRGLLSQARKISFQIDHLWSDLDELSKGGWGTKEFRLWLMKIDLWVREWGVEGQRVHSQLQEGFRELRCNIKKLQLSPPPD